MSLRDIKDSVVKELDWKLKNEILEQTNYDLLVKLIDRAEDEKEVSAIFQLGTQYYKTGLKYDVRLEKTSPDIHYLKKNEEKSFETDPNALTHKLIIGDNYHALLNLLVSHRGLIDVIYIDPPYGCDSMGQFADTNYDNHITRDNLLSMLHTRLILAKQLLSETGVIFCSIDDKNQAYIKCLFDNVFGEENFIANLVRKSKGGSSQDRFISPSIDYCIVYAKNKENNKGFVLPQTEEYIKKFKNEDLNGKYTEKGLYQSSLDPLRGCKNQRYYIKCPDGELVIPPGDNYPSEKKDASYIEPITVNDKVWRWSYESYLEKKDNLIFKQTKNSPLINENNEQAKWNVYTKQYLKDEEESKSVPGNIVEDCENAKGSEELKQLNLIFDFPKPTNLIKYLMKISNFKNGIILDFFAGSGTTGQAVLDLNREDGGNRKFILCTNNDKDDINLNGIAYDVTCERLKRVMTGKDYNEENNFKWAEKNEPYGDNLLVCECETINNFTQTPGNNAFEKIDETLYDQKKMNDPDKIKWVCENFNLTCKYIEGEE